MILYFIKTYSNDVIKWTAKKTNKKKHFYHICFNSVDIVLRKIATFKYTLHGALAPWYISNIICSLHRIKNISL